MKIVTFDWTARGKWGLQFTQYVIVDKDICRACRMDCENRTKGTQMPGWYCSADVGIKRRSNNGDVRGAAELLVRLPTAVLRQYLEPDIETPVPLRPFIFDELHRRGELHEGGKQRL